MRLVHGRKSPVRRIAGNTSVQVFGRVIEFAIFLFLVHYLDLKAFGAYTFILTNLMLWGVLADAGTYNVLIREAASRENADRLLGNALSIGLISSTAAVLTSNAFLYLSGQGAEILIPALIASLTLFVSPRLNAFRRMFQVRFQAELRMGYVVAWNTVSHLLMAGLLVVVVLNKGLLVAIFCALIAAEFLSFAGLCITHRHLFELPRFRFDTRIVRTLLRQSIPLMLASVCVTVHDKIGIMLLESIKSKEAVGLYNMAARIPDSLPFLASIFIASVFPVMVRHRDDGPGRVRQNLSPKRALPAALHRPGRRLLHARLPGHSGPPLSRQDSGSPVRSRQRDARPAHLGDGLQIHGYRLQFSDCGRGPGEAPA